MARRLYTIKTQRRGKKLIKVMLNYEGKVIGEEQKDGSWLGVCGGCMAYPAPDPKTLFSVLQQAERICYGF